MKKMLSLLLVIVMLTTISPVSVSAYTVASGTCGDNLTWVLDSNGTLTVSGNGAMKNYNAQHTSYEGILNIDSPWCRGKSTDNFINTVIISEGVTSIGIGAFCSCRSLTNLILPNSLTTIQSSAFGSCTSINNVTLPDNYLLQVKYSAFWDCSNLKSVTITNNRTTIDGDPFAGCSLTDVYYKGTLSQWNTFSIASGSTTIKNANIHYLYSVDDTIFNSTGTDSFYFSSQGEYHYWKMTPSQTATYIFESTLSSGDSYGYLYDTNWNQISSNDDC